MIMEYMTSCDQLISIISLCSIHAADDNVLSPFVTANIIPLYKYVLMAPILISEMHLQRSSASIQHNIGSNKES